MLRTDWYTFLLASLSLASCGGASTSRSAPSREEATLPDSSRLTMRAPAKLHAMGPSDSAWRGRALVVRDRLEIVFPAVAFDNVGCAAVDSSTVPHRRRYYWLATARYPDSHYPNNHFQQVALDFELPADLLPTRTRLDSALASRGPVVVEAAGEPAMHVRRLEPSRAVTTLSIETHGGERGWKVRTVIQDGAAVTMFLAARADSVTLSWCQRSQWLTYLMVPLER